jgi:hypothetical protein
MAFIFPFVATGFSLSSLLPVVADSYWYDGKEGWKEF